MKIQTKFATNIDWLRVANLIHDNYRQMEKSVVDKKRLLTVLQAFEDLYAATTSRNEDDYYIGNLVQSGQLEGRREEVVGTVSGALGRTRRFINRPGQVYGRQASIIARNLVAILSVEEFNSDLVVLLAPHYEAFKDLAGGKT